MTTVASNSITVSNVSDGTITHTAYSNSADGTDGFTTVYPNLNLLDGTKDFSGSWENSSSWVNDGTYKGLTVKKRTGRYNGIYKTFTVPKDGVYTFSAYVKGSGNTANIFRYCGVNSTSANAVQRQMGNNFDWIIDSVTLNLKANDNVWVRYEISGSGTDSILWNAGHKWEEGSIATPYMQSASEVTTADWPKYIGYYTDLTQADSTNPSDYTWGPMRGEDGVGVTSTVITYANSTSGTTAPSTGWTSSIPSPVKGQYFWTKTVWTSTDTSSKTAYSVSYISKDGTNGTNGTSGIIVSSVAPASPQNGQLWQDTSTTPQLVKKWTGSEWVIWELYAQNLKADSLSALSANLGDVSAGTVKLMDDNWVINGQPKMYGIYQSKLGLLSSGPTPILATTSFISDSQMSVASLNKGGMFFTVTDYTEDLKKLQEFGMNDQNNAFIKFNSYENGRDVMTIGSSGDIVFKGNTSQDTPWITLSSGVKYKFMFSRVYISVNVVGNGSSYMQFGTIPQNYRPIMDQFMVISNWGAGTADDRHMMVRASDGAVVLWAPKSGITYGGEVSYTL